MAQATAQATVHIKVQTLTSEGFRPYGQVLERGTMIYPEAEEGKVAMELLRTRRRPNSKQTEQPNYSHLKWEFV